MRIKKILLTQNANELKNEFGDLIIDSKLDFDYILKSLADEIEEGELYDCLEIKGNDIIHHNIGVDEINQVGDDYEIKGIGIEDEEIILMFSNTAFWYQ